jgi:MFS family permease
MVQFGAERGFLAIAILAGVVVTPLAWLLIRDDPADVGLFPDGEHRTESPRATLGDGVGLATAIRAPVFWYLSFGLVACGVTMSFPSTHLMPYAMDMHTAEMTASTALGLAGGLSLPAALVVGWMADRMGRGRLLGAIYALRGITYIILIGATSDWMWFLAAVTLGLSWTGTVPLSAAIAADHFGQRNLATITGAMVMGMWMASGVAAYLAGLIYDHSHTYYLALLGNALLGFMAALMCIALLPSIRTAATAARERAVAVA